MKWKAEAVDRLRRYDAMRRAVENIPEEMKRLELLAHSIQGVRADGAAVRGGGCREDVLIDNLVQRQALQRALEQAKLWLCTTDRALSVLSAEEKRILEKMLIHPERGGALRLCEELDCEQSSIYRKRDRALHKFTIALYGAAES